MGALWLARPGAVPAGIGREAQRDPSAITAGRTPPSTASPVGADRPAVPMASALRPRPLVAEAVMRRRPLIAASLLASKRTRASPIAPEPPPAYQGKNIGR